MSNIKFRDMQWDGMKLVISFDSKEVLEKVNDDLELILINRASKDIINIDFSAYNLRETGFLTIDFNYVSFGEIKDTKGIFDLAFRNKDAIYKICRNDELKIDKSLRYMLPSYKLDNKIEAAPYYTMDNRIAVLVGDSRTIAKAHSEVISDKISLENIEVCDESIICTLDSFNISSYESIYLVLKDRKSKKEHCLNFAITDEDYGYNLKIDLSGNSFWTLGSIYDLYLETKVGQVIISNRIGLFSYDSTFEGKKYDEININDKIFLRPYITKDGAISIHAIDEQRLEKEKYTLVAGKRLVNGLNIVDNKLTIDFSAESRELFYEPELIKLIVENIKAKESISIELEKDAVINKSSVTIDLQELLNDSRMQVKGRWNLYLKSYSHDTIRKEKLIRDSVGVDSVKNRYMSPIPYGDNLLGVVYTTAAKELAILCTNIEGYTKEVYKIVEGYENIHDCNAYGNELSFKIDRIINKDLVKNVSLILTERKTKTKRYMDVSYTGLGNKTELRVDFSKFINEYSGIVSRWDFHIEFTYDSYIERKRLGDFRSPVQPIYKRFLNAFKGESENLLVPYFTIKNELSMVVQKESAIQSEKYKYNMSISDFSMKKNIINVKVYLEMNEIKDYKLEDAILSFRSKAEKKEIEIAAAEININGYSRNVGITIDIDKCELEQIFWDVYIVIDVEGEKVYLKVKNPTIIIKDKLDTEIFGNAYTINNEYIVYPYITGNNSLALTYRTKSEFETDKYKLREVLAYGLYKLFKSYFDKKDIWLVYEKFSETAQDNSFYFYKYCYHNEPNKNVYYVIRKDSPDYQNLKGMESKVLDFMSLKHLLYLCAAKILVSSESKTHGYAWRVQKGRIKQVLDSKKHAFLQHGVTALKRVDYVFNKKAKTAVDLFVVTSDYERKIIRENFGYNDDEIITTGFCRWDELIDKSKELETKEIFLMPTWRNWLDEVSEEKFVSTPYFKNYMALLNSEKLHNILMEKNIKLNFYLHPKFKYYIDNFYANCENINIIQFGEQKVNELLMRTSLLITDYSSVAWDVYYQKKPVLFYQFDFEDYNAYQGSYMDMETELFGDRVFNAEDLIKTIEEYVDNNFAEKSVFSELRKGYFKYIDTNNSKRAFESIKSSKILTSSVKGSVKAKNKLTRYRKIRQNKLVYTLWNIAKKNKKTFEAAKKIKSIVRRLTIPV